MARHKISVDVTLTEVNCGNCGGTYAINESYRQLKAQEGGSWNCPYCQCGWGYSNNNENSRLKKELEQERKRKEWALQDAKYQREQAEEAERRRIAQKAATTRLRNRAKAGICPCCNRQFKQLEAHMKNKHPDFKSDDDSEA